MQTTFGVSELAERWGISPESIRNMEKDGKLHRLPQMPGVRFSAAEVYELENIGPGKKVVSYEKYHKLLERNAKLEKMVSEFESMCRRYLIGGTL